MFLVSPVPPRPIQQLRAGLPPGLRFIGLSQFHVDDVVSVVENGFPMVRLVRIDDTYFTVKHKNGGTQIEEWPKDRVRYNLTEWLEWYGCEHAEWRDATEFL